jgi:predicted naringenin-chalcone synthase
MSAPGLDLQMMALMDIPNNIFRTSVNFMGCYAAIHAMKMGDMICRTDPGARVLIVCTELCTLHFQQGDSMDNIASGLLFADGAAAVLMTPDDHPTENALHLKGFYAEVVPRGSKDMAWELSSTGFLMTLSGYVPNLIGEDIGDLVDRALAHSGTDRSRISHWCVHPGGRKILEAVGKSLQLESTALDDSHRILREYGNMSSPTILFVLKEIMGRTEEKTTGDIFGLAFGPGLTMETFVASRQAD